MNRDLEEKINGLKELTDCRMPNNEEERIEKAMCAAYNQAINDVLEQLTTTTEEKGEGWISVENETPMDDDNVLVFSSTHSEICMAHFDSEDFHIEEVGSVYDITHWKALPKPPTK